MRKLSLFRHAPRGRGDAEHPRPLNQRPETEIGESRRDAVADAAQRSIADAAWRHEPESPDQENGDRKPERYPARGQKSQELRPVAQTKTDRAGAQGEIGFAGEQGDNQNQHSRLERVWLV